MKNLLLTLILGGLFVMANVVNSRVSGQEDPFRIGIKLGYPQVAGLNFEYVTPLLNKRLAADLDLSYIPLNGSSTKIDFSNYALCVDYYFSKEGKGLYGGLGYGITGLNATKDVTFDSGTQPGKGNISINSLDLKIGGKHGNKFYFRWELGWGVALNSPAFEVTATNNGVTKTESFSYPFKNGAPIIDLGFGVAF